MRLAKCRTASGSIVSAGRSRVGVFVISEGMNAMETTESLEYAKSRLSLAKVMNDTEEVMKWAAHVKYWENKLAQEQEDAILELNNMRFTLGL